MSYLSVAGVPRHTASRAGLDESTVGRLEALKQSLLAPQAAPVRHGTASQRKAFRRTQVIRSRYADGEPFDPADLAFMRRVLDKHPHAAQKIGPGVQEILCGSYVGGTRCFFVLRTDGSLVDFSARACLGQPKTFRRSPRLLAMMARFSVEPLRRAFRAYLAAGTAGKAVAR